MSSPIKYSSRTYTSIINDINSDNNLVDRPEWFKRIIAGVGDMLSMINNASANQGYLDTSFTRQAVKDLLELIDYDLTEQTTSTGTLIFYLAIATAYPLAFTRLDLKAKSTGNTVLSSKPFESRLGDTTAAAVTDTFTHANPNNYLTVNNDLVVTGHKVRFTTTNTLPTGLSLNTDYYLARISATTVSVSTSVANVYAGTYVDLTAAGAGVGVHTLTMYSISATCYQQDLKYDFTSGTEVTLGATDGITSWEEFDLPDKLVLPDTLAIKVGANSYTEVDTFVDSDSTDKVFKFIPKDSQEFAIRFADGTYGILPAADTVYSEYAVGGGVVSNVSVLNTISIYSGGNSDILGVSNPTTFTGGADEETLASAKRLGPLLLKARNRFITVEDGEALMEAYGGIAYAKINKNVYGVLTAQALGIADGGGNPAGALKTLIEAYLEARTPLEEIAVTFDDVTLTALSGATAVVSAAKVASGYTYAGISDYFELAWKLFFTETGKEISEYYTSNGITLTITLINTIFTTTFTYSADGTELERLLDHFQLVGYRQIGDTIQESDAYALIQGGVAGIDYMTITTPAFPIALGDAECTTHTGSTFTLTEIV